LIQIKTGSLPEAAKQMIFATIMCLLLLPTGTWGKTVIIKSDEIHSLPNITEARLVSFAQESIGYAFYSEDLLNTSEIVGADKMWEVVNASYYWYQKNKSMVVPYGNYEFFYFQNETDLADCDDLYGRHNPLCKKPAIYWKQFLRQFENPENQLVWGIGILMVVSILLGNQYGNVKMVVTKMMLVETIADELKFTTNCVTGKTEMEAVLRDAVVAGQRFKILNLERGKDVMLSPKENKNGEAALKSSNFFPYDDKVPQLALCRRVNVLGVEMDEQFAMGFRMLIEGNEWMVSVMHALPISVLTEEGNHRYVCKTQNRSVKFIDVVDGKRSPKFVDDVIAWPMKPNWTDIPSLSYEQMIGDGITYNVNIYGFMEDRWKVSFGVARKESDERGGVRYTASTLPGFSGAPVLKAGTNVVLAVHQDKNSEKENEGCTLFWIQKLCSTRVIDEVIPKEDVEDLCQYIEKTVENEKERKEAIDFVRKNVSVGENSQFSALEYQRKKTDKIEFRQMRQDAGFVITRRGKDQVSRIPVVARDYYTQKGIDRARKEDELVARKVEENIAKQDEKQQNVMLDLKKIRLAKADVIGRIVQNELDTQSLLYTLSQRRYDAKHDDRDEYERLDRQIGGLETLLKQMAKFKEKVQESGDVQAFSRSHLLTLEFCLRENLAMQKRIMSR